MKNTKSPHSGVVEFSSRYSRDGQQLASMASIARGGQHREKQGLAVRNVEGAHYVLVDAVHAGTRQDGRIATQANIRFVNQETGVAVVATNASAIADDSKKLGRTVGSVIRSALTNAQKKLRAKISRLSKNKNSGPKDYNRGVFTIYANYRIKT